MKLELQKEIKILYAKTNGFKVYNKSVDIGKLIEEFASNEERKKGLPIGETYKLFDFGKLESYYRKIHKNNEKNLKESIEKINLYKSEYSKLMEICKEVNTAMIKEKNKYSVVLKSNLRIIRTKDIESLQDTIEEIVNDNIKKINDKIISEMIEELKANLNRRILVWLSRYKINNSEELEVEIKKIMESISGTSIKDSLKVDMDLILDVSEEYIQNSSYRKILLKFTDINDLSEPVEKISELLEGRK